MRAIMTTDPFPKSKAVVVQTAAGAFTVGGIAKGSGMIEPRMATMLGFLTTDARVPARRARSARSAASRTRPSTRSRSTASARPTTACSSLASGASGVSITRDDDPALLDGLRAVSGHLAREIVRGGEGATKLVTVQVTGAASRDDAWLAARTIANSPLVKTAIHGGDPNWGRLVAAAGRSGAAFVLDRASVAIGDVQVFVAGVPHDERADQAAAVLQGKTVTRHRRPRHRRRARGHDVDVRLQRRVRAHQRGVPNMRPQARRQAAGRFPVPAADRTHVPVGTKDFLSVLDLSHQELDRVLDLAAELKRRAGGRPPRRSSRWRAGTSRCSSRSRRCARERRSRSRSANWAARSSSRRPTSRSAAARRSRTSRATSSAGSTAPSSAPSRRRAWIDSPRPRPACTSSTPSPTRSTRARRSRTC